jgi:clan AA aspartic protease (TIGR02281 family)
VTGWARAFALVAVLGALAGAPKAAAGGVAEAPSAAPSDAAPSEAAIPSPDELLARWRAATGADHRPDAEREEWAVRLYGLSGTLDLVRRGADTAIETMLGPFRTARGESHGQRWRQNENGQTILEQPEPSQSETPADESVERIRDPVDAWVLTTTYASGHSTRLYYDPRTYYLMRSERTNVGHTTHTVYEDYRTDGLAHARPWHYYGGDDRPENDFDYHLERDDESPTISDADLAVPPDRRPLVEFPAGDDEVRLPARIDDGQILVRLDIQGRPFDFVLDTGCSGLTITEETAHQLGLPIYGESAQTVAGSFVSGRVIVPEIAIGSLTMHNVVLHTAPVASAGNPPAAGLLGFDFIDAVGLRIDYAAGTIDALRPGSLAAPAGAEALDVRLNSGTPVARAGIGDAVGDDFILDTGAAFSFVLFQRFTRAHPESSHPGHGGVRYVTGVGGKVAFRPIETKRITLGSLEFDDAAGIEALSPYALGFDTQDGLIGSDILKQFTLYLDYGASRVYLAPPAR